MKKIILKWRIEELITESGLSIEDFCRMLEIKPSFFRQMLYNPYLASVKLIKVAHLMRILEKYLQKPVTFNDLIQEVRE